MAITVSGTGEWVARGVHRQMWETFNATGVGTALSAPHLPDKTVAVQGTWGGTILVEGSNDKTATGGNWFTLNDPQGNALSFTTGTIEAILENPRFIRPKMSTATGTPDVDVFITSQSLKR